MSQSQNLCSLLQRSHGMLTKHLADFTDADLMVRPVEGANHAAWQLLHVLKSSTGLANGVAPEAGIVFPAKYAEAATKAGAASDDPAQFPSKGELLQFYETLHTAVGKAVAAMSDERLAQPAPEQFASFAPTVGQAVLMIPMHTTMHIGQIQVIRRKLNKPVLF